MRMCVVSVYDQAVGAYGRPAFCRSEGEAIRSFADEINRSAPDNAMHAHPEHFTLFFLAHFDDASGAFANSEPAAAELVRGSQVKV